MLDLEPLTVGPEGMPELASRAKGCGTRSTATCCFTRRWSPCTRSPGSTSGATSMMHEPLWDLSIFAGQGSATIGPPVFMHRASSPGPTVPRKHHKGENPHETSPVIGAALRYDVTTIEASIFGAQELTPADSRFYPHPSAPTSFAARVRRDLRRRPRAADLRRAPARSGRRRPDAWQASASATSGWLIGATAPRRAARLGPGSTRRRADRAGRAGGGGAPFGRSPRRRLDARRGQPARGAARRARRGQLAVAVRDRRRSNTSAGDRARRACSSASSRRRPTRAFPTRWRRPTDARRRSSLNVGLHLFGMWMLDCGLRPMHHDH